MQELVGFTVPNFVVKSFGASQRFLNVFLITQANFWDWKKNLSPHHVERNSSSYALIFNETIMQQRQGRWQVVLESVQVYTTLGRKPTISLITLELLRYEEKGSNSDFSLNANINEIQVASIVSMIRIMQKKETFWIIFNL